MSINISTVLYLSTSSRVGAPSPAILPNAQTDCLATLIDADCNRLTSFGIAPALTTASVWSDVPDAMFVNAHAASYCKSELHCDKLDMKQLQQFIHRNISISLHLPW